MNLDRVIELANQVQRLEAELGEAKAALVAEVTGAEGPPAPAPRQLAAVPTPTAPSNGHIRRGERAAQVAELWKRGTTAPAEIARELGITVAHARQTVHRARASGLLPKAPRP